MEFKLPIENGSYQLQTALFVEGQNPYLHYDRCTTQTFKYRFTFEINKDDITNMKMQFECFSINKDLPCLKENFETAYSSSDVFIEKIKNVLETTNWRNYEYKNIFGKCKLEKL